MTHSAVAHLYHLYFIRLVGQPGKRPVRYDSPRWQPIYTLQSIGSILLSKREAKIEK